MTEERHVEHGPLLTQLDDDEHDQHEHPADQRQEDQGARPAAGVAAEDADHDEEQRRGEGHETAHVRMSRALVPGLRDPGERNREREDADRDVDEEDPAPPKAVGEETADQRARGNGSPDRGAPDGKRPEAVGAAVLVADERQCSCEERGAADPLERPGDIERRDVPGDAAEERGEGEKHDACHEDQAASVPVGERARSEDQRGERERIGVDDPLQASQAGTEALLHVRQRDDYNGDVEKQHERRQADGEQRPLPHAPVAARLHTEDGTEAFRDRISDFVRRSPEMPGARCRGRTRPGAIAVGSAYVS